MTEERRQILEMLAQGKITVAEAEQLLSAVGASPGGAGTAATDRGPSAASKTKPKYLHVLVESGREGAEKEPRVNIRVPMQLLRAGVRLASLIPAGAQERVNEALNRKGIHVDLANLKPADLQDLIENLGELTLDVEGRRNEKVRIYCE